MDHIIVGGKNDSYFSFKEKHVLGYQHNKLESDYNNLVFPTACVAENNSNQSEDMEAEMKVNEEATVRRRRGKVTYVKKQKESREEKMSQIQEKLLNSTREIFEQPSENQVKLKKKTQSQRRRRCPPTTPPCSSC